MHRLAEIGLIELSKGSYGGPGLLTNRVSRIRAAKSLRARFLRAKFGLPDIALFRAQECVILRDEGRHEVEYEDTAEIAGLRARLRAYNEILSRTFIDMPQFDESVIERAGEGGERPQRFVYNPMDLFIRRIFSRSSWGLNGRFYGGWWQTIDEKTRKTIHINGVPTVEVDFTALHINILSLEAGSPLEGDPYRLQDPVLEGVDHRSQRKYLKRLVLS